MTGDAPDAPNVYRRRAALYEIEYQDTYDLAFWQYLAAGAGTVLAAPCGHGTRALALAAPGRRVVAGDLEPAMIARLAERLRESPPPGPVVPVVADLRDLSLDQSFDLILVVREGFQLLTDEADALAALASLKAHLAEQGRLVIDLVDFAACRPAGPYPLSYFDPDLADQVWVEDWCRTTPEGATYRRWHRQDTSDPRVVRVELRYALSRDEEVRGWEESMAFRRYTRAQFLDLADKAGLSARTAYGGYDGRP